MNRRRIYSAAALGGMLALASPRLQGSELAWKARDPVADLLSVPIESTWDFDGYTANVQPVIPFSITKRWSLVTRTIIPILHMEPALEDERTRTGLGDVTQSLFLVPRGLPDGWIMGGGPELLYPTATDGALGDGKWGAGPTAALLRQTNGWTYGILGNHVWSFAGRREREEVSASLAQLLLSHTFKSDTTLGMTSESAYDWKTRRWLVPLDATIAQVVSVGRRPMSFELGPRYYFKSPAGSANWGLIFTATFLFP